MGAKGPNDVGPNKNLGFNNQNQMDKIGAGLARQRRIQARRAASAARSQRITNNRRKAAAKRKKATKKQLKQIGKKSSGGCFIAQIYFLLPALSFLVSSRSWRLGGTGASLAVLQNYQATKPAGVFPCPKPEPHNCSSRSIVITQQYQGKPLGALRAWRKNELMLIKCQWSHR